MKNGTKVVALTLLLVGAGALFIGLVLKSQQLYASEMQQHLNRDLAEHIVAEGMLLSDGAVNHDALEHVFHMMMVVHPSIELYLLDTDGKIFSASDPYGKVVMHRIDLTPIHAFLAAGGRPERAILGQNPRDPEHAAAFSAAPIYANDELEGFLYVVLDSEAYRGAAEILGGSFAARVGVLGILLTLIAIGVGGWIILRTAARRERLHQVQRSDLERRELIATISHDLRTPLTSLRGSLDTLLHHRHEMTKEERQSFLQTSVQQSDRLERLIEDLFELAKLDSASVILKPESFAPAELVQDVVQKFEWRASDQQIDLLAELDEDLPLAFADIGLIERVLENLIDNALKHTPSKGQVHLRVDRVDDRVMIEVRDNGHGIPPSELPHVFKKFHRAGSRSGSGLGLSIVKKILDLHQSTVEANSLLGEGTSIRFDLPTAA